MPKVQYIDRRFQAKSMDKIALATDIITEYNAQGYNLTVRQLYYQMVARALIPNNVRSYKRLGSLINDARLAGLIDWDAIVDRTRQLEEQPHWSTPESIIESAAMSYRIDKWKTQPYRPEIWIEKDALTGVIAGICIELDIPYFSCRGYTSASSMWRAGYDRLYRHIVSKQTPVIIHLGDHDPSGIDMTRDIKDRLELFSGYPVKVDRIALNEDQIEQYNPPPNPTKLSDSRAEGYIALFGYDSWELDALEPSAITALIEATVMNLRDHEKWAEAVAKEKIQCNVLDAMADQYNEIADYLGFGN